MGHRLLTSSCALLCAILLSACGRGPEQRPVASAVVDSLRHFYAPDDRLSVYDVSLEDQGGSTVVKGEVDNATAKDATLMAIRKVTRGSVLDSIVILPDPNLGDKKFGIVSISVGNVRAKSGHPYELTTQALMGTVVKLLKKHSGWYYVQLPDNYLGWLEESAMKVTDEKGTEAWKSAGKVIVTSHFALVRDRAATGGLPVSDAVPGMLLKNSSRKGGWVGVELPDGRRGFIESSNVEDFDTWKHTRRLTAENVENTAKRFIGVPYLWGGTSSKGMDCSGFVKTVYRLNGVELSRDADQQARMGEAVDPGKEFGNLRKGDLLFFGRKATSERPERITHVGIYLERGAFIHSPGGAGVKINSFDAASPVFSEGHRKNFVRARRLIGSKQVQEVAVQ